MIWFSLSLSSALSKSASQILTKRMHGVGTLQLAGWSHIFSALIILPLIPWIAFPQTLAFWLPALLSVALNVVAILMLIEAIKQSDLSYSIPFLSLTPVFAIGVAFVARGETLSLAAASGILLIVIGAFSLDTTSLKDALQLGGRRIFSQKGVQLVIAVALIYSVSSVCDKSATVASSPLTYVCIFTYARSIVFGILLAWHHFYYSSQHSTKLSRGSFAMLFLIGVIYFLEAMFQMNAFDYGNVAETIGVKRLSILFTSLSGFVLFKEKATFSKIFGAVCLICGSIAIYLFR
jgi:drug/metabolite transporter (DMT)-like permease